MTRISRLSRSLLIVIAMLASLVFISCVDSAQADVNADQAEGCRNPNQVVGAQDRAEILDLIERYGPYFDYHEGEAWASLFTDDGELNYPTIGDPTGSRTSVKGHDQLAAFASGGIPGNLILGHFAGRTILISAGPSRIRALTPVGTIVSKPDVQFSAHLNGLGVYVDDIVKTADGWRFQKRTADSYSALPMSPEFLPCQS